MSPPTNHTARTRAEANRRPGQPHRRPLLPWIAVAVVVLVAVGVALLGSGDDDDAGNVAAGDGSRTALATAEVSVTGEALPPLGDGEDPAVGNPAPTLAGVTPDGTGIAVEPIGRPTLLAFLAHWCPHCQAELPRLVDLDEAGELDELRPVVVLTGTDESAPNHPPAEWLEREGWTGEVLVDDSDAPAARAFGLSSYPYLVLLDADGRVIARSAGELGESGLRQLLAMAG